MQIKEPSLTSSKVVQNIVCGKDINLVLKIHKTKEVIMDFRSRNPPHLHPLTISWQSLVSRPSHDRKPELGQKHCGNSDEKYCNNFTAIKAGLSHQPLTQSLQRRATVFSPEASLCALATPLWLRENLSNESSRLQRESFALTSSLQIYFTHNAAGEHNFLVTDITQLTLCSGGRTQYTTWYNHKPESLSTHKPHFYSSFSPLLTSFTSWRLNTSLKLLHLIDCVFSPILYVSATIIIFICIVQHFFYCISLLLNSVCIYLQSLLWETGLQYTL